MLDFAEADLRQRVFKAGVPGEPGKVVGELKREEEEVMQGRSAGDGPDTAQTRPRRCPNTSGCPPGGERAGLLFFSTIQSLAQPPRHFLPMGGRWVLYLKDGTLERKVEL